MDEIIPNSFQDLWLNKLTEKQRRSRAVRAFRVTRKVATKQLDLLKKFKNFGKPDGLRFTYFYETVKNIWSCVDFALSLGKGKNRGFAFYPARTVMENTFRLEYFTRQKPEIQEEIAVKELLRICKRNYDNELKSGNTEVANEFKDYYNNLASDRNFPTIEQVKISFLEPFSNLWDLTQASKIVDADKWYFHYQALAELTHGKLMHLIMAEDRTNEEYRISIMYLLVMCNDVLKNIDYHLNNQTRQDVVRAIKEAESIVKKLID